MYKGNLTGASASGEESKSHQEWTLNREILGKFFLVHNYLSVNAMIRPMQVREDEAEYGKRNQ